MRSQATRLALVLCAFALPSIGCVPRRAVIPDPTVPHQVAEETEVVIWTEIPASPSPANPTAAVSRTVKVKTKIRLLEGWWIAGPPVVEP